MILLFKNIDDETRNRNKATHNPNEFYYFGEKIEILYLAEIRQGFINQKSTSIK